MSNEGEAPGRIEWRFEHPRVGPREVLSIWLAHSRVAVFCAIACGVPAYGMHRLGEGLAFWVVVVTGALGLLLCLLSPLPALLRSERLLEASVEPSSDLGFMVDPSGQVWLGSVLPVTYSRWRWAREFEPPARFNLWHRLVPLPPGDSGSDVTRQLGAAMERIDWDPRLTQARLDPGSATLLALTTVVFLALGYHSGFAFFPVNGRWLWSLTSGLLPASLAAVRGELWEARKAVAGEAAPSLPT